MNEFLEMHIFFIITAVTVVVLGTLIAVVLWRLSRILKIFEHITEEVAQETENIRTDIAGVRQEVRSSSTKMMTLASSIWGLLGDKFHTRRGKTGGKRKAE